MKINCLGKERAEPYTTISHRETKKVFTFSAKGMNLNIQTSNPMFFITRILAKVNIFG